MLAAQCGKLIKEERVRLGLKQDDLAKKARVSRAVLSRLERGRHKAVQSDTLDRLMSALALSPQLHRSAEPGELRRLARLEQEIRLRQRRERHLRLALELADDEVAAAAKIAKARERVELWRIKKSCSPFYIERWSGLLARPAKEIAREMSSLGEWQDALFQNSPWSWAWN
jgi:transcriptional regulator with XRE-family HTH domain